MLLIVGMVALGYKTQVNAAVTGKVTASTLYVRTGPSEEYPKLISDGTAVYLSRGDSVFISHSVNSWYYVTASFNGKKVTGYVSANYILTTEPVPTGAPSSTPTPTPSPRATKTPTPTPTAAPASNVLLSGFPRPGTVNATSLNVRNGAESGATRIAGLPNGTTVSLIGVRKNSAGEYWYQISFVQNGVTKTGYVHSDYIKVAAPTATPKPTSTPKPTATPVPDDVSDVVNGPFPRTGHVTASSLRVRRDAGTSKTAIASIANGTVIFILSAKKDDVGDYWYQISFTMDGVKRTGYVHSKYVAVEKLKVTPTPLPEEVRDGELITKSELEKNQAKYYYPAVVNTHGLNLREEPTAASTKITSLSKNSPVMLIDEARSEGFIWYKVAVKIDGQVIYGYMSGGYVDLVFGDVLGYIDAAENQRMRTSPSDSSGYVKTKEYSIISLKNGEKVTIIGETKVGITEWFKISVEKNGTEYTGYVKATYIRLAEEAKPTATPTAKPTQTPKPTGSAGTTPAPTARPTVDPKVTPTPSVSPTPTALPTPKTIKVDGENYPVKKSGTMTGYGHYSEDSGQLVIYEIPGRPFKLLKDVKGDIICITSTTRLYLYDRYKAADNNIYWHVGFRYKGDMYYGYVQAMWIEEIDEDTILTGGSASEIAFEFYLDEQGFPESYKPYLRELHRAHPDWIFKADHTGLAWDIVLEEESLAGKNLISNSRSLEWKSFETGAYDWTTDKFVLYDGSVWVTASKAAVAYYMDPRNFLNEENIFMFEVLRYAPEYQNEKGVEAILKGTPFYKTNFTYKNQYGNNRSMTYAEAFIAAAEYSGVSPYHLAARAKQEVVISATSTSNSVSGKVSGLEGLYNFYNIGAYHSTVAGGAIANGLKYAKYGATNNDALNEASLIPWDNQYRAIVGGAYILGSNYINRGQDTIYLQKFNVTDNSTFYHQYMANVEAPYAESKKTASAYAGMKDAPIVFSIPIYLGMPEEDVPQPEPMKNPNNWLKSLRVINTSGKELQLTPTFNLKTDQVYYLVVDESDYMIQFEAEAVSATAKVTGTGFYALRQKESTIVNITVEAENGDKREYDIIVVRP